MEEQERLQVRYVPVGQVLRWARNSKRHDIPKLKISIRVHGFKDPPKYEPELNDGDGGIVEGNGRDQALWEMYEENPDDPPRGIIRSESGEWEMPVLFGVDAASQEAAEAYGIDHNNLTVAGVSEDAWLAMFSMHQETAYLDIVTGLHQSGHMPVSVDEGDLALYRELLLEGENGSGSGDPVPKPQIEKAEELRKKWGTESGQKWVLGDHVLICGDCLDHRVRRSLFGPRKADLIFTDPPYNIDYNSSENPRWRQDGATISNDKMSTDEWHSFCASVADQFLSITDDCIYVCHAPGPDGRIMAMELDQKLHSSTTIIWNKDRFTLGRGKYQNKYEPIWFGWSKSGRKFTEDRDIGNVWDIDRPGSSEDHPTMKPVELVEMALAHASGPGDIVYDPFAGSGSTLMACQRMNRVCRSVELEPKYTAVILERYLEMTGQSPEMMKNIFK